MSTTTQFIPPPVGITCSWPIVCQQDAKHITHANGVISGTVNVNTLVTFEFGGRVLNLCKTERAATYTNAYTMPADACFNDYTSNTSVSENLNHESVEILYVNNQHNVIMYKKTSIKIVFNEVSSDFVGTVTTGGFPMIGKVSVTPKQQITEQIILSKPSGSELMHTYSYNADGGHHLILVEVPEKLTVLQEIALQSDVDIKTHGGYYFGNWLYPPWIASIMGEGVGRDAIWRQEAKEQTPV